MMKKGILSFSGIGSYGHMGNQCFQLASTIGIAVANGMDYLFPTWPLSSYYKNPFPQMDREELNQIKGPYIDREGPHHYEPLVIQDKQTNWDLGGYLQSYKYWTHCDDLVRSYFEPKDEIVDSLNEKYGEILSKPTCSIHVRHGDYVSLQCWHPICTPEYYQQAINLMPLGTQFLVFSDDMDWCRQLFVGPDFHFIDGVDKTRGGDPILDQILMSMCQNNITANSSFSLFAAYLNKNPNKIVVSPSRWFGPCLAQHRVDDMYLPNSIII